MSKKYGRSFHLPFSPGTTSDDRIAKSVDSLLNQQVVITEKLDGENAGMTRDGVYARSHATFTTSGWSKEVRRMHDFLKHDIAEEMTIFGENMEGIHSIEYENLTSYLYVFGIREGERWYSWQETEDYAFLMNLPTVPVLFKGILSSASELEEKVLDLVAQPSALGGKREGIVIRLARSFTVEEFPQSLMKWVRKGHVQSDAHWTRTWKKALLKY